MRQTLLTLCSRNWDELNNTEGSIQRLWTWGDNIYHLNSEYFACSYTGVPGPNSYHAPHTAGSVISINYTVTSKKEDDGRPWTFGHSHGPMSAYLAACPDEGCQGVDLSDTMWYDVPPIPKNTPLEDTDPMKSGSRSGTPVFWKVPGKKATGPSETSG
jgi:hypothetical protein